MHIIDNIKVIFNAREKIIKLQNDFAKLMIKQKFVDFEERESEC